MSSTSAEANAAYHQQAVDFAETIWESRDRLLFLMHGAGAPHALIAKETGLSYRGVVNAVQRLRRKMLGQ